jgi:hypothetical protein
VAVRPTFFLSCFLSWPLRAQAHFSHTSILTRHTTCKNRNSRASPGSGISSSFYDAFAVVAVRMSALRLSAAISPSMP